MFSYLRWFINLSIKQSAQLSSPLIQSLCRIMLLSYICKKASKFCPKCCSTPGVCAPQPGGNAIGHVVTAVAQRRNMNLHLLVKVHRHVPPRLRQTLYCINRTASRPCNPKEMQQSTHSCQKVYDAEQSYLWCLIAGASRRTNKFCCKYASSFKSKSI